MTISTVAALQLGSTDTTSTVQKIMSYEQEIIQLGCDLVVLPEAILGGYPKGESFGTQLGYRLPTGRETFLNYFDQAIEVPGEETLALAEFSARCKIHLVIGVIEKSGSSLYCTALFFDPKHGLVGKHRKLMPTGTERLIWGMGDGSTLPVFDTTLGKIGAAICWENHMPLLRTAMYAKGIEIWCAPTVDERDIWQASMRHIAHEGRNFVISACQYQPSPKASGRQLEGWDEDRAMIRGGSVIVDPMGEVLAGPLYNQEGLITAQINIKDIVKARYDFDVVGHYARPDVFSLNVDEAQKNSVNFIDSTKLKVD
ncbi:carbon-nitrogen hydrolase family protein [Aliiglaciecola sp. M165]|uniref:carbon-nitrogen hydrolase family protein n=1 Tax=Aliiglaciecola sp. M165 TaxID=2593649 RepID=UPI00117BEB22|nr:carbon-nitrogen hydrolase family protein [Aliiglaciecola sp. M165]TRY29046.1 carbon-nitrogen hydrolase family protein [Aliiglaciecola sp. M165]